SVSVINWSSAASDPGLQLAHAGKPTVVVARLALKVWEHLRMRKDEERLVANHNHSRVGDVVGLEYNAGGAHDVASHVWTDRSGVEHVGVDSLRAQAADPDALCAVGDAHPFGERHSRVLCEGVWRRADLAQQNGGRRRRTKVKLAAGEPTWQEILCRPAMSVNIDVECQLPLCFRS